MSVRFLAIAFLALGMAACSTTPDYSFRDQFLDGTLDIQPRTKLGQEIKTAYDTCRKESPTCVRDRISTGVKVVRLLKASACLAALSPACISEAAVVIAHWRSLRKQSARTEAEELIVDELNTLTNAERNAAFAAVLR